MDLSIFDAIGPIMIGPSSSHTAGATRIGWLARHALGDEPKEVEISFHPSLLQTYKGHKTDTGLVAGLLGLREDDEEMRHSLRTARERNISVQIRAAAEDVHPNTMGLRLITGSGEPFSFVGISVGGGNVSVTEVDGYRVDLNGKAHVLLVWSDPCDPHTWGVDGAISSFEKPGTDLVLTKVLSDRAAEKQTLRRLEGRGEIRKVRYIPPLTRFVRRIGEVALPFVALADLQESTRQESIVEAVLSYEASRTGASREEIRSEMGRNLVAMEESVKQGLEGTLQLIGGFAEGNDGQRLWVRSENETLVGSVFSKAMGQALAAAESNAAMGRVVASPTAGSAGVVAGVVLTLGEERGLSENALIDSLLVAAGVGVGIGHVASLSGAVGGCQGEIGVASAMAAASAVHLGGGDGEACLHAAALALKSVLGLACDPACGPVEVPCIKRNAAGVANALAAAEMALSGVRSVIPPGEVALALKNAQDLLPQDLRGSTGGGLGSTPTAARMKGKWEKKVREMKKGTLC